MTNDEAFLEAIREQPDDDAPRLIYADWLEEHARPDRAEFIRVQCELVLQTEGSPRWYDLSLSEEELRAEHDREWLGSLWEVIDQWQFRRGFLELVVLDAEAFLEHGNDLFRLGPIRQISLQSVQGRMEALAYSPVLKRLPVLDLSANKIGPEDLRILTASPHLAGLRGLILDGNPIGTEGASLLRQAPFFAGLHSLHLCGTSLDATAVEFLTDTREPIALRELSLDRNILGSAGVHALTAAPTFCQGLTWLSLSGTYMEEAGLVSLLSTRCLQGLVELDVSNNSIGSGWNWKLPVLANSRKLQVLGLGATELESPALTALANSSHLDNLTSLDLSDNHLGAKGVTALRNAHQLGRLTFLDLSSNQIGDEGATALAQSPHLATLTFLRLAANGLGKFGVHDLVMSPHLSKLHSLDLHGNNLGEQGAQVIARWTRLPQLTELNLRNNHIGDLGAKELAASPNLPCLRVLNLSKNNISFDEIESLETSPLSNRLAELDLSGHDRWSQ